jgi:hypothetical protein
LEDYNKEKKVKGIKMKGCYKESCEVKLAKKNSNILSEKENV